MSSAGQSGARPGSDSIPDGTDDLRTRMKLRLAQNKAHAERESAARVVPISSPSSSFTTAPPVTTGLRERPTGGGVSQMVWNSVLDSLSAPSTQGTASPVVPVVPASAPVDPAAAAVVAEAAAPELVMPDVVVAPATPVVNATPVVTATPAAQTQTQTQTQPQTVADEQEAIADLFKPAEAVPDFGPIVPAMPVLAPPSRNITPPRPNAPIMPEEVVAVAAAAPSKKEAKRAKSAKSDASRPGMPMSPTMMAMQHRKKRHPFRSFLTFVLVLGLLGGAGFAGWYKFLRHRAVWSNELRPTAAFVEQTVHRSFDKAVPVKVLSAPEYEVKLGLDVLDRIAGTAGASASAADSSQAAATTTGPDLSLLAVRAVGLVGADVEPTEVGRLVSASSPTFYSSADHTIYRLGGDSTVVQVSLIRSMTAALLDQDVDVSSVVSKLDDSQRAGFDAMLDGVVAQVVAAKFRADPTVEDSYAFDLQTRRTDAGIIDGMLPVYLSRVVTSADVGVFGYAGAAADDPLRNLAAPPSDAPVFDPTRDAAAKPATAVPAAGTGTDAASTGRVLGVEFWFDALVPVLGAADARSAALLWTGDQSLTTLVDSRACLTSTIATATPETAATLAGLLGRWAQSIPASTNAAITPGTDAAQPSVAVSVCEPTEGVAVPPTAALDDLASFFTQPDIERALLARVGDLGLQPTPATNACVVAAYRNGSIPGFTTGAADPTIITALTNVVTFCRSAG